MGPHAATAAPASPELTCDALTSTFRVLQRRGGHRFSVDDRMTAWVAATLARGRVEGASGWPCARSSSGSTGPLRVLDLGTGIGSVLLMVAWAAPEAELVGVEAQAESYALLTQNVERNGLVSRVRALHGDLRARVPELPARSFDLVTGTPPYLPPGTATPSPDAQRAAARIELRGGIEAYLVAAAHAVAPDGRVVVCADGRTPSASFGDKDGMVVGALVGGLLGNQVGGGSGKKVATVAGAVGSAYAGREIDRRHTGGQKYTEVEQVCRTVSEPREEVVGYDVEYRSEGQVARKRVDQKPGEQILLGEKEVVVGYDVTWRYDGQTGNLMMDEAPGDRLPIKDGVIMVDSGASAAPPQG